MYGWYSGVVYNVSINLSKPSVLYPSVYLSVKSSERSKSSYLATVVYCTGTVLLEGWL